MLRSRTALLITGLAIIALVIVTLVTPGSADAQQRQPTTDRVSGATRLATAVAISEATWTADGPSAVFIANGYTFADALTAPSVAGTYLGPILLVDPDAIPPVVADELDRLTGVDQAFVLGGTDAVSASVEQQLQDRYGQDGVVRLAGQTRFETAAAVAREVAGATGIGIIDGKRTAFLADGTGFADALTVGPASYEARLPVLLTAPDRLPAATRDTLEELDIEHVVIAGGTAAVSSEVAAQVDDSDTTVERLAGRDRTDTAVRVALWELAHLGYDRTELLLARGDAFPDSLAVGPLAASLDAPVLLTRTPDQLSYDLLQFLANAGGITGRITAIGGAGAVTPGILDRAAQGAKEPLRTIHYFTGTQGPVEADFSHFSEHVDWTLTDQRGWSLNNDFRYSQVSDPGAAEVRIWLSDPNAVANAAPVCSAQYSCTVGDDVYINEENWDGGGEGAWGDPALLDEYRHYVVTHEVGHWVGFGHVRCDDYWHDPQARPMPAMEQQSKASEQEACGAIHTWPLKTDAPADPWGQGDESESTRAYDLYPQGDSTPPSSSTASTSDTADADGSPRVFVE